MKIIRSIWLLLPMFLILIFANGCGKLRPAKDFSTESFDLQELPIRLEDFQNRKISQFRLLVFKADLNQEQWKVIFQKTDRLAFFESEVTRLNRISRSASDQERYLNILDQLTLTLIDLEESAAQYLLYWTENENCIFQTRLNCRPIDPEDGGVNNPFVAGLPVSDQDYEVKRNGREVVPALTFPLTLNDPEYGKFRLKVMLKPEKDAAGPLYRGDVEVEATSTFIKMGEIVPHFPIGYAELRLVPPN